MAMARSLRDYPVGGGRSLLADLLEGDGPRCAYTQQALRMAQNFVGNPDHLLWRPDLGLLREFFDALEAYVAGALAGDTPEARLWDAARPLVQRHRAEVLELVKGAPYVVHRVMSETLARAASPSAGASAAGKADVLEHPCVEPLAAPDALVQSRGYLNALNDGAAAKLLRSQAAFFSGLFRLIPAWRSDLLRRISPSGSAGNAAAP
jgi:hypothetical protein